MKILVIGSGAREHALCWQLRQSKSVQTIYCAPGNPGIAAVAELVPIAGDNISALVAFAEEHAVDLTIVGPELPLTLGIVDTFESRKLKIFGPTKAAAQMEASKSFAKEVMLAAGVPTASYAVCTSEGELRKYLKTQPVPVVLKADGLAAGKGVFVCSKNEEIEPAIKQLFGPLKSERVVVEQFLSGVEASFIVATDGTRIVPLASSHDYKRIFDGDRGPNTGGMGTVSPSPRITPEQEGYVCRAIIAPTLAELRRRGCPFKGFLYAGLMISNDGKIHVIEYNARLGDPETQVIMRRMQSSLAEVCLSLSEARPDAQELPLTWSSEASVCVVLAAHGYPDEVRKGDVITGIEFAEMQPGIVVFHAGTALSNGYHVTSGGRVLSVTAVGSTLEDARSRAYRACDMIQFQGVQCRRDIGLR